MNWSKFTCFNFELVKDSLSVCIHKLTELFLVMHLLGFPGGLDGKESACNAGEPSSIPGLRRYPEEGKDNPL